MIRKKIFAIDYNSWYHYKDKMKPAVGALFVGSSEGSEPQQESHNRGGCIEE